MQLEEERGYLAECLNARSLDLYPDLQARERVLRRFGFVHEEGRPTLKVLLYIHQQQQQQQQQEQQQQQ